MPKGPNVALSQIKSTEEGTEISRKTSPLPPDAAVLMSHQEKIAEFGNFLKNSGKFLL